MQQLQHRMSVRSGMHSLVGQPIALPSEGVDRQANALRSLYAVQRRPIDAHALSPGSQQIGKTFARLPPMFGSHCGSIHDAVMDLGIHHARQTTLKPRQCLLGVRRAKSQPVRQGCASYL